MISPLVWVSVILACFMPVISRASDGDASSLVSKDEAGGVIGPVTKVLGPKEVKGTGESAGILLSQVVYQNGQEIMGVTVYTFSSAGAALSKMTKEYALSQIHARDVAITAESELGDRAFWCVSPDNAAYFVVEGAHVVAISVGDLESDIPPASHKAALRKILETTLRK